MTEERRMLRDTVATLVAKHADPAGVRAATESDRRAQQVLGQLMA